MHARGRQVIVVDDDVAVLASLAFLLEVAGYAVRCFASAPLCLQAIAQVDGMCLVLDQHMPEMTGLEFLAELQRLDIRLPTLLMTGSPSPELLQRAMALDVRQVLAKPLAEDALLQFVAAASDDHATDHV